MKNKIKVVLGSKSETLVKFLANEMNAIVFPYHKYSLQKENMADSLKSFYNNVRLINTDVRVPIVFPVDFIKNLQYDKEIIKCIFRMEKEGHTIYIFCEWYPYKKKLFGLQYEITTIYQTDSQIFDSNNICEDVEAYFFQHESGEIVAFCNGRFIESFDRINAFQGCLFDLVFSGCDSIDEFPISGIKRFNFESYDDTISDLEFNIEWRCVLKLWYNGRVLDIDCENTSSNSSFNNNLFVFLDKAGAFFAQNDLYFTFNGDALYNT